MFGKRFSISATTLAVAGACSVMFSSPDVMAQGYYQQTGFPGYGRPRLSGLSAVATRPPAFSDTAADASAMSPNSWGESAISNPYAGYRSTLIATTPEAITTSASIFVPPRTKPLSVLAPTPAEPSKGAKDALTNTEYSRSAERPDRYADASFAADKDIQLSKPPALPKIEFPAQKAVTDRLDQIPFDVPELSAAEKKPSASFEGIITPDKTDSNLEESQPQTSQVPLPVTHPPLAPTLPSVPQPTVTQPTVTQPMVAQQGYPIFTPAHDQPMYVLDAQQSAPSYIDLSAPSYIPQSSSLIGNEIGLSYPQIGQMQNQSYLQTPSYNYGQGFGIPTYHPNVAHRWGSPTTRNQTVFDQGELFDHENKKKEFPPFSEIIAQGRFFGSLELAYLRPHFLGNTGISIDGPTFSESIPFEFDNETAPHVRFGFESKYGPGFELNYFTLNANSNAISRDFDGISSVTTIASITGPNRFTQLSADAIGETLNANHSFEIETFGFNVFKDIEFKVSRIGGRFGFTYANIAQSLEASVTNGGTILDTLDSTSDFRGFGPKLGIDYYRPVGHTPLEFVTSFSGLGLFGRRDQFVNNSTGLVERRFGADEFIAMLDLTSGIQYKKTVAENRAWFARLSFSHQTWLGGGTAVDPTGDFGMKGILFAVGYNR